MGILVMMEYSQGVELIGAEQKAAAKYSLGNLGFSNNVCVLNFMGMSTKEETISCSRGNIQPLLFRGILSDNANRQFTDGTAVPNDYCGAPDNFTADDNC